jgi:YggT family protein
MSLSGILNIAIDVLTIVVFIGILLRYILDPYHPIRSTLDSLIEPMLAPIRRLLPPMGGFDFSPIVLIILIRIGGGILVTLLRQVGI